MDIPDDLREFLDNPGNRKFRCHRGEIREATFFAPDELSSRVFDVCTSDFALNERWERDPQLKFEFPGVDLIKSCNSYPPEGILIWFPSLGLYGSWDCDHHSIMVFPGASWTELCRELGSYINAPWNPDWVEHRYLRPWESS